MKTSSFVGQEQKGFRAVSFRRHVHWLAALIYVITASITQNRLMLQSLFTAKYKDENNNRHLDFWAEKQL